MASYLVTGGCGFIGSHLVDALIARGDKVRILDDLSTGLRAHVPGTAEVVVGDVGDGATVRRAMQGVVGCFHLAAIVSVLRSVEAWTETHRVNLGGTIHVFEAAAANGALPVIYASSAAVYGDNPMLPFSEDAPLMPVAPYGADKAAGELHARAAFAVHGVPSTSLRFFNVFGPRQNPASAYTGVISIFADRIRTGRPLTVFGDGEQTRDFVFVSDVVAALIAAMDKQTGAARVFNVCRGEGVNLLRLIADLERAANRKAIVEYGPARPGDPRHSRGNPGLLREEIGFVPTVELKDGLSILLRWLESPRAAAP